MAKNDNRLYHDDDYIDVKIGGKNIETFSLTFNLTSYSILYSESVKLATFQK